jgi:hypothetical protein
LSSVAILFLEIFCFFMASASCHATTSRTAMACVSSKMAEVTVRQALVLGLVVRNEGTMACRRISRV